MNKSKIEWCDMTWNPVTGCLHGCEYCYARRRAQRFCGKHPFTIERDGQFLELFGKVDSPYPDIFDPTFHRYRLNEPQKLKQPQNIFVCSMADLFGEWVPDDWIQGVFEACQKAPQHRYLFLTKNPDKYRKLLLTGSLPLAENIWYGTTIAQAGYYPFNALDSTNNFLSVEPMLCDVSDAFPFSNISWVILGAETGNRKNRVIPEKKWIEKAVARCQMLGIPVFMKDSLAEIWKEPLIKEFPWELPDTESPLYLEKTAESDR